MKLTHYKFEIDTDALLKLPITELTAIKETSCFLHDEVDKILATGRISGEDYTRLAEQRSIQWNFIEVVSEIIGQKIATYLRIEDLSHE